VSLMDISAGCAATAAFGGDGRLRARGLTRRTE